MSSLFTGTGPGVYKGHGGIYLSERDAELSGIPNYGSANDPNVPYPGSPLVAAEKAIDAGDITTLRYIQDHYR